MKAKWMIITIVIGLLIFGVGCVFDILVIEFLGAIVMLPPIAEICDRILPAKKDAREAI